LAGLEDKADGVGAASWALKGFEYQAAVSVWLALDLIVANRLASEMTLEPVSEEDIEAEVEEFEPGTVAGEVPMRGYQLIVQAKRREGNAWTEGQFINLLEHGKRRVSALQRLTDNPAARYLLVTSAALNAPVRQLGVRHAGTWPAAACVPENVAAKGKDIAGRLAIIATQDDERLETDIKTLLLERFRVPRARWEDCFKVLCRAAWDRMRGQEGGHWTREQVERIVADHEGYLVSGSEHDIYVQPTNWGDLTQALTTRNAIMIIGQSGSGKTATAEALWLDRKAAIPDLKRVHITQGPDQLRIDQTLPPVLYDIEDPWGRFKFEPDSRPWNDQLALAFGSARHDRLFIATSRADVASASGAEKEILRWRMSLDAENYGRQQLRQLYGNLSIDLPPELAAFAHEREAYVLQQLSLPLELRKFFDALPQLDPAERAKYPEDALTTAIDRAHRDSIERTVFNQIEARDAIKPAAILWALIKPHGRLSVEVLRSLDDRLVDADSTLEDRIGGLVDNFITARNLRQAADGSLAYYHGKVEAGIEASLAAHPQTVRRILRTLIDVLIARDDEQGDSWGVEAAAEIVQLSQRIEAIKLEPSQTSQDRLDRFVETALANADRTMETSLRLAAFVGSSRSHLSELARWLEHRKGDEFPMFMDWMKPERGDVWYAELRADPAVRAVIETYVRSVVMHTHTSFPDSFAQDLEPLAGNVTNLFVDAALSSAGFGYFSNIEVITAGALVDLDQFEAVVDAAIDALQPTPAETERREQNWLSIVNDEVSEDYAEHFATDDDGMTARTYLQAYVEKMRTERGFTSLAGHRHLDTIRHFWLHELLRTKDAIDPAELDAAFTASFDRGDEDLLWTLLARHWDDRFSNALLDRLVRGHEGAFVRLSAVGCAANHCAERFSEVVSRLQEGQAVIRLAQLANDLGCKLDECGEDKEIPRGTVTTMIENLPEDFAALAYAALAMLNGEVPLLSVSALETIGKVVDPAADVRLMRVKLARHFTMDAREDIRWILDRSDDHNAALDAIDVAIGRDLATEIESTLDHRFAHVAAEAITAIGNQHAAPLPQFLLARADRKSSPVRKALLAQLKAKPHPCHLSTLVLLSKDEWSRYAPRENDDGDYPVAREAIELITALDTVPDNLLGSFVAHAKETEDLRLMDLLLSCVIHHGNQGRQSEVLKMSRRGKRIVVGQSAAFALMCEHDHLTPDTIAGVTVEMVLRLPASIAINHALTIGLAGEIATVDALADALVASDDRRIFLALLALGLRDRANDKAQAVAAMLPAGHPARAWAAGEEIAIEKAMFIDLGDAASVKEAYRWMKPQKQKSDSASMPL